MEKPPIKIEFEPDKDFDEQFLDFLEEVSKIEELEKK